MTVWQEGFGLIAATRKGINNKNKARFSTFAHQAAQMTYPPPWGALFGHSAGGAISYPTYITMFHDVYLRGKLSAMMWRNRIESRLESNKSCHVDWFQRIVQIDILGGDHDRKITIVACI